jgi:hypothetical protein
LQKEGFQHLAKSYSYNYCEYYEQIPGNNLFMIFYLKIRFLAKTLRERKSLQSSHTLIENCSYTQMVASKTIPANQSEKPL